ncbi:MAG: hypothetical protein QNJ98_15170 [Planctomycetota bacterium]|nr:hypothetical protein [Planctomycetota bacterium]
MRRALCMLGLCFLTGLACADDAARAAEPMQLEGAPAVVIPPDLPGKPLTVAPGQWQMTWTGKGAFHQLQARVFPVRGLKEPGPVLMQALDTLVRNNGFGAFGATARTTGRVWGRPHADAAIQVSINGQIARGHARLLLATDQQWAFAWGLVTSPELTRATLAEIQRFTKSLEPRDPTFHTPRFRDTAALQAVVYRTGREQPITGGHLRGVSALIEAGIGRRLPAATRRGLESMLLMDVRQGTPGTRQGYRASAEDVVRSMQLEPTARAERMQTLGKRIVEAIETRAKERYAPAVGALRIWTQDGAALAGEGAGALTRGDWLARVELAGFLLSIVRDEQTRIPQADLGAHRKAAIAYWTEQGAEPSAVRALWARLRHAWDAAKPKGRQAFRHAVLKTLLMPHPDPDVDAAAALGLPEATALRAMKRWMGQHGGEYAKPWATTKALTLSHAELEALVETLGVDAAGYQFGW